MNGIRLICDTNPLIYMLDGNMPLAKFLNNKQIYVSVITELELFGKQNLSSDDSIVIESLLYNCFITEINREIKQLYKQIKQNYTIKLPDAIIAATAIYLDIPLLTFDKGFRQISELQLLLWDWDN
ncbi:MAG: type II toxin-antitoxin system VapC family toxin [Dysgonamonadaceae bacterium]|jgi:predicted nucleic acid-binding protein|nr:type II toxin-antitoxin system VapC family toxin [Dysgonamonadaceae bacterium]